MEIKVNKYIYFNSLIKKLNNKATIEQITDTVNQKIASASRRFIRAGKVTPSLAPSTIKRKGHDIPLIRTHKLVNSIRATKKGITYEGYGNYHRRGDGVEKREFIAWYTDKNEKNKIISNVKRDLSKLIKENLRKK